MTISGSLEFNYNLGSTFTSSRFESLCQCRTGRRGSGAAAGVAEALAFAEAVAVVEPTPKDQEDLTFSGEDLAVYAFAVVGLGAVLYTALNSFPCKQEEYIEVP